MKKQLIYLIGLLNITKPTVRNQRKDSKGETFVPANINTPMNLKTVYPMGINTWENITPDLYNQWANELKVSQTYTRFIVTPVSDRNIKKGQLTLITE